MEANLAWSAAGLLAWTSTCIWEKQAAKRGQGHGHSGRKFSGNRCTEECGVSGGPENTFRCTLGGVRAREGTKIMNEKEKKEKEKSKSKSEGACSEREGEWRGEGGGGGGGEGAGERESEAREKRDLGKKKNACVWKQTLPGLPSGASRQ